MQVILGSGGAIGNTESAFNQVWHLPTSKPFTGQ